PYGFAATFPRYVRKALKIVNSKTKIEVVNLGMSAINTYTIRDFVPGVIKHKPDLVLIYAGHNEYYGALGAGSTISLGNNRFLVNAIIKLREFKTTQLLQNIISGVMSLFADGKTERGTLMARMIGTGIEYDSDAFHSGISQFEGNMDDILTEFGENNIPVIIGSLTMNLKQKPFLSSYKDSQNKSAVDYFRDGLRFEEDGQFDKAKESFTRAKEYDDLRFRAPSEINEKIKYLARKHNATLLNIDSLFSANSPNGITGFNLMVDHLHPNVKGYYLIGKEYYKAIQSMNLGKIKPTDKLEQLDSFVKNNLAFTDLDSTIADIKRRMLLGSYPFVGINEPNKLLAEFTVDNFVDSLALKVQNKDVFWEDAHEILADRYLKKGEINKFMREIDAILGDRPFNEYVHAKTVEKLIDKGYFREALKYLIPLHELVQNAFTFKWLGSISLYFKDYKNAKSFLEGCLKYDKKDPQVYYNLAGAYFNLGDSDNALAALETCLKLNPNYDRAKDFIQAIKSGK
ncbi:MAG: tetratricopeptide repeat protein, partial [Melioribacteraceae bacterium]|nr:tetratricopeptide repeat protein [Melioribacteraceae bacterium]